MQPRDKFLQAFVDACRGEPDGALRDLQLSDLIGVAPDDDPTWTNAGQFYADFGTEIEYTVIATDSANADVVTQALSDPEGMTAALNSVLLEGGLPGVTVTWGEAGEDVVAPSSGWQKPLNTGEQRADSNPMLYVVIFVFVVAVVGIVWMLQHKKKLHASHGETKQPAGNTDNPLWSLTQEDSDADSDDDAKGGGKAKTPVSNPMIAEMEQDDDVPKKKDGQKKTKKGKEKKGKKAKGKKKPQKVHSNPLADMALADSDGMPRTFGFHWTDLGSHLLSVVRSSNQKRCCCRGGGGGQCSAGGCERGEKAGSCGGEAGEGSEEGGGC